MDPLFFEPYLRPQVWGGRLLHSTLGKTLPGDGTFGESWELSAHPHHVSRVVGGTYAGKALNDLWANNRQEIFGVSPSVTGPFPLLIKFLDCHELLSVQVHPNDAIAQKLRPGELGKTESWVVLKVEPTGRVYAGLKPGVTEADMRQHLAGGTVDECLHAFQPKPGDCLFLKAGTVHAVGGGVLMAEVQQSSDATFRLFDWNRPGTDGKPRELHIEDSIAAIDWNAGPLLPRPPELLAEADGWKSELLAHCEYFTMRRHTALESTAGSLNLPAIGEYRILMALEGAAQIHSSEGSWKLNLGQTAIVPAKMPACTLTVASQPTIVLDVTAR